MTDPIEPVTNDKIYGMMAALQVSLRALTKSHPNPAALIYEFHQEHEETYALLVAQDIPDSVLESYRSMLHAISPNTDVAP
ncbi:hypothetical protein EAH75_16895 [Rhodanobacter glycinis]|uniref:hypothetical protein n=1 Tax=Rhodanobacter glycinis TaxID=582702 RepID=UPI001128BCE3|nr:hypothetical protein [Rhodanobacter glycinis]TPG46283.1 hypothetical protein EAH75_16895 [Rhodanobacter glycinis]